MHELRSIPLIYLLQLFSFLLILNMKKNISQMYWINGIIDMPNHNFESMHCVNNNFMIHIENDHHAINH